jgi:hypothetical protein
VSEDTETLFEMMLTADRFCRAVASGLTDRAPGGQEELQLKLAQCAGGIKRLREYYDQDCLTIRNPVVRADVRQLILGLMWVAFYAREFVDRRTFRMLVMIEAAFSHLLASGNFDSTIAT